MTTQANGQIIPKEMKNPITELPLLTNTHHAPPDV